MPKALTLYQPLASLVALGIKTIETRSWSTQYRGRLAIHAAKSAPNPEDCIDILEDLIPERYRPNPAAPHWRDNPQKPGYWSPPCGCLSDESWWHLWTLNHGLGTMPLGCIVATCELTNVMPILMPTDRMPRGGWMRAGDEKNLTLIVPIEDQRPYGDFTPGRFAWILSDIKPTTDRCPACWGSGLSPPPFRQVCRVCHGELVCASVPAKGHSGIWEWVP
ncbi:MAG: ASCH domain-containing protein [Acidimicrobiales bacterium]